MTIQLSFSMRRVLSLVLLRASSRAMARKDLQAAVTRTDSAPGYRGSSLMPETRATAGPRSAANLAPASSTLLRYALRPIEEDAPGARLSAPDPGGSWSQGAGDTRRLPAYPVST